MRSFRFPLLAAVVAALLSALLAGPAMATSPTAKTEAATDVTATTAVFHSTVSWEGPKNRAGFKYGLKGESELSLNTPPTYLTGASPQKFSATVKGLIPNTTYEFRILVLNLEGGYAAGEKLTFTTKSLHPAQFEFEAPSASISGAQASKIFSSGEGIGVSCSKAHLTSPGGSPTQSLALAAEDSGCNVEGATTQVKMNSCHYSLELTDVNNADYGVACGTAGDTIDFVIEEGGTKLCTFSVPAQIGPGVKVSNKGEASGRQVNLSGQLVGVKYSSVGELCYLFDGSGEAGTYTDGVLPVTTTLEAVKEGKPVGMYVTGETPVNLSVTGTKSETPSKQPHFSSEAYPSLLSGVQMTEVSEFEAGAFTFDCGRATFSGGFVSEAVQSLGLVPEYGECDESATDEAVQVSRKSCSYSVGLNNAGPPYNASLGVICTKGGDRLDFTITEPEYGPLCTVSVPPQSIGGTPLSIANEIQEGGVRASGTGTGVEYSTAGEWCFIWGAEDGGTYHDGKVPLNMLLGATYLG